MSIINRNPPQTISTDNSEIRILVNKKYTGKAPKLIHTRGAVAIVAQRVIPIQEYT